VYARALPQLRTPRIEDTVAVNRPNEVCCRRFTRLILQLDLPGLPCSTMQRPHTPISGEAPSDRTSSTCPSYKPRIQYLFSCRGAYIIDQSCRRDPHSRSGTRKTWSVMGVPLSIAQFDSALTSWYTPSGTTWRPGTEVDVPTVREGGLAWRAVIGPVFGIHEHLTY